jgi:hypothetical protein
VFGRLRLGIRSERIEVSLKEKIQQQVADTSESTEERSGRRLRTAAK